MKLYVIRCRENQEAHHAPACYEEAKALEFAKRADAGSNCPNTDHQVDVFVPARESTPEVAREIAAKVRRWIDHHLKMEQEAPEPLRLDVIQMDTEKAIAAALAAPLPVSMMLTTLDRVPPLPASEYIGDIAILLTDAKAAVRDAVEKAMTL